MKPTRRSFIQRSLGLALGAIGLRGAKPIPAAAAPLPDVAAWIPPAPAIIIPAEYDYISVLRLTRVMQALEDAKTLPNELRFVDREPAVLAIEGECYGRWLERIKIADLIDDDVLRIGAQS